MSTYSLNRLWAAGIRQLGMDPAAVLRSADLPADLASRAAVRLSAEEFFALWQAMDGVHAGGDVALAAARALTTDTFSPVIFAGLCSPDLATAAHRIARLPLLDGANPR